MTSEGRGPIKSDVILESKPSVSIITAVYNSCQTLEQTIKSVLGQDYDNIEYVIIDGGSTDGSIEIIEKYREHISCFISEPDEGLYYAMNKGLARCTGDIIGILNSDDWYESNTVSLVVDEFRRSPNSVIYGIMRLFDGERPILCAQVYHGYLESRMIPHPATFVAASVYHQHGFFDTRYRIAADYDLMLRFADAGVLFCPLDRVLANFRIGGACDKAKLRSGIEQAWIRKRHNIGSNLTWLKAIVKAFAGVIVGKIIVILKR